MAALLTTQTTDTTGTGAAMSGPCSVLIYGTFDGAQISLQAADSDTASHYQPVGFKSVIQSGCWLDINIQGSYYLRAIQSKSGASTSLSVVAIQ